MYSVIINPYTPAQNDILSICRITALSWRNGLVVTPRHRPSHHRSRFLRALQQLTASSTNRLRHLHRRRPARARGPLSRAHDVVSTVTVLLARSRSRSRARRRPPSRAVDESRERASPRPRRRREECARARARGVPARASECSAPRTSSLSSSPPTATTIVGVDSGARTRRRFFSSARTPSSRTSRGPSSRAWRRAERSHTHTNDRSESARRR